MLKKIITAVLFSSVVSTAASASELKVNSSCDLTKTSQTIEKKNRGNADALPRLSQLPMQHCNDANEVNAEHLTQKSMRLLPTGSSVIRNRGTVVSTYWQ